MAQSVTMHDLARLANVHISTVSRALSDSPLVKPETKEHVLNIANEIGYVVNASARNLRRQSSETIGIVIPIRAGSGQSISDPFFLEMVGAVAHAASTNGYDLILNVPPDESQIAERRLLQTGRADGLIVIGQAGRAERLRELGAAKDKLVVWGGMFGSPDYTLVGSDNVRGGYLAVEHLLKLGRRHILFLGDTNLPEVALRYDGARQAHADAGVSMDGALKLNLEFGGQEAFDNVLTLIDAGTKFDAVFAASDVLAMAAIHALQARGHQVPQDVSVVGYDNIGQAALMMPPLTTVDQNIQEGGRLMVDLLLKKLAGETVSSTMTPTELIVRASCGGGQSG